MPKARSAAFSSARSSPKAPTTWAGVDAAIRSAAPQVRLLVAEVTHGSCRPVHSIDPGTAAPLGSAFKLYVLDALATAVAAGKVSWTQPLTVTARLKSLPSGQLQTDPDGTKVSVQDAAAKMISISDNTAADMLINLLGRPAVEAALTTAGMADPARDQPFLTTRELFTLKLDDWPTLADRYLAASQAGRRALLASVVDRAPLPALATAAGWTTPRDINTIEWFASADDMCHVYASLAALARRPGLSPVADVLQINDGGLGLNPAQWKTTWFKGGIRTGGRDLDLSGHHPDRAQLRRRRARREPRRPHLQPGKRVAGHALGHQRSLHPGRARLIAAAAEPATARAAASDQHRRPCRLPLPS